MHVHITQDRSRQQGPNFIIDCPACGRKQVAATSYDEQIVEKYFGLVPLHTVRRSRVECQACKSALTPKIPLSELAARPPSEISLFISLEPGFVEQAMAAIAIVVSCFPLLGLIVAAIACILNRRYNSWSRTMSYVALALSVCPFVFGIVALVAEAVTKK